jgi:hypothetical protein
MSRSAVGLGIVRCRRGARTASPPPQVELKRRLSESLQSGDHHSVHVERRAVCQWSPAQVSLKIQRARSSSPPLPGTGGDLNDLELTCSTPKPVARSPRTGTGMCWWTEPRPASPSAASGGWEEVCEKDDWYEIRAARKGEGIRRRRGAANPCAVATAAASPRRRIIRRPLSRRPANSTSF